MNLTPNLLDGGKKAFYGMSDVSVIRVNLETERERKRGLLFPPNSLSEILMEIVKKGRNRLSPVGGDVCV